MKSSAFLAFLCCTPLLLHAEDYPGQDTDRRVMRYLQKLSDKDLGRKLPGVRLDDGTMELSDHTLVQRIELPRRRAHIYVLREGPLATGAPTARAWVDVKGKALLLPETPAGEPRETAYSQGEVYTYTEIDPGSTLIEISSPTERWIKSLQEPHVAASWGVESMATIDDPEGRTNVRDEEGKVIATVTTDARFLAIKPRPNASLWEVYLPSGVVGLMHGSRIRVLPGEPLMRLNFEPCREEWKRTLARRVEAVSQIDSGEMPAHPKAYYPTLLRASEGDTDAIIRFFSRKFDDAPADSYVRDAWKLLHLTGDDRFAELLPRLLQEFKELAALFSDEWTTSPISDGRPYLQRYFPKSSAVLFGP